MARRTLPRTPRAIYNAVMTVLSFEIFTVLVPQLFGAVFTLWHPGASMQNPLGVPRALYYLAVLLYTALPLGLAVFTASRFGRRSRPAPREGLPLQKSVPLLLPTFMAVTVLASLGFGLFLQKENTMMPLPARGAGLLVSFVCLCLISPIGEEILFRGTVQPMLQGCGPWTAILGQAVLFGAAHSFGAPMLTAFVSGAVLGLVYTLTGDLRLGMILHSVNNTIGFLENYAYQYGDERLVSTVIFLLDALFLVWAAGAVLHMKRTGWKNRLYPVNLSTGHGQLIHSPIFLAAVGCMILAKVVGV